MSTLLGRIFGRKNETRPSKEPSSGLDVSALRGLMSPEAFAHLSPGTEPAPPPAPVKLRPEDLSGSWTMKQTLEAFPEAQRALFQRYHVGGCSSCGFSPEDSLSQVCVSHGLDVVEVVSFLKDSSQAAHSMEVDPSEAAALLKAGTVRFVDVRTPYEFDIARIEGSMLVDEELAREIVHTWPKDTPVITVCHHGIRSLDAAAYFRGHGMTDVRSLAGGIDRWSHEIDRTIPRY